MFPSRPPSFIPFITLTFYALLAPAQATLLVYEPFSLATGDYAAGSISGQNSSATGFNPATDWTAALGDVRPINVSTTGLSYDGLQTQAGSGSVTAFRTTASTGGFTSTASRNGTAVAPAAVDNILTVWSSFLFNFDLKDITSNSANPFALVIGFERALVVGINVDAHPTLQRTAFSSVGNTSTGSGQFLGANPLSENTTHLFLVKAERNFDTNEETFSLWINPTLGVDETELATPTINIVTSAQFPLFTAGDSFSLGTRAHLANVSSVSQELYWDEFRLGTTLASVTPIPEPGLIALLAGLTALGAVFQRRAMKMRRM